MKNKMTLIYESFEKISESHQNLVGGFSKSFSNQREIVIGGSTDNCWGGNCAYGCNGNISCNTVAGCGPKE